MKIAWFTEGNWNGKVARTHPNMRNDSAWMCVLDAEHYCINTPTCVIDEYDLGIITLPKNISSISDKDNLITELRKKCKKLAFMQEGPHWYFQDYKLEDQIWYYNTLSKMDILFVHNVDDSFYYRGLFPNVRVERMTTLMLTDNLALEDWTDRRSGVMIGGNMCSWYGGIDSFIVAQEFNCEIYAPSMGRRIEREETLGINHLPFMPWHQWMNELNKCKFAVHLMRTKAAGTFALNCAFLGVPCIGYGGIDTQENCFPDLTIRDGDVVQAKKLANLLATDKIFYDECSQNARMTYSSFDEIAFLHNFKVIYDSII